MKRLTLATLLAASLAGPGAALAEPDGLDVATEVLALERARAHAPNDPQLLEQLGQLAAQHQLQVPQPSLPEELTAVLDANGWLTLASAGLGALVLWLGLWAALPKARLRAVPVLAGLTVAVAGGAAYVQSEALDRAVVMAEDSAGRISPVPEGDVVFAARAGDVVDLGVEQGGWRRVTRPDGARAWMPTEILGQIRE